MSEIEELTKRTVRIEDALKRFQTTHVEPLDNLIKLAPSLISLKATLDNSQKLLEQTQNITESNIKAFAYTKYAAKNLYEETMKLISDLRNAKEIEYQKTAAEISYLGSVLEVTDRKIAAAVSKSEERLASEALDIAKDFSNVCEGNKDYVKACVDLKAKQIFKSIHKDQRSPIKEEGLIEDVDVDETVESFFTECTNKIQAKLKEAFEDKIKILKTLKANNNKEQARALIWGIEETKNNKNIRQKITNLEKEFEDNIETLIEELNTLEFELSNIEIEYLTDNKKSEVPTKIAKFYAKAQDSINRLLTQLSIINTIDEVVKELDNLHNEVEDNIKDEVRNELEQEKEILIVKHKGEVNFIRLRVDDLNKRLTIIGDLASKENSKTGPIKLHSLRDEH